MTESDGVRLLAIPPSIAVDRPPSTLADVRQYVDPDGVWIPGPKRRARAVARARQCFDEPVVHPPLGDSAGPVRVDRLAPITVVTVQRASALPDVTSAVSTAIEETHSIVLVCDEVRTAADPTALETTLEPAESLVDAVPSELSTITLCTGAESATYDRVWHLNRTTGEPVAVHPPNRPPDTDPTANAMRAGQSLLSVRILGTGPVRGYRNAGSMASITIDAADGDEDDRGSCGHTWPIRSVDVLDASSFGLEAISGVGPKTADRLAERGIDTREALLDTPVSDLTQVRGIGRPTAWRMHQHARVLETDDPIVLTDESLPGADWETPPLCFDIETDGLSPTIIWQLGVYDPVTDEHRAFVEKRDPTDPGRVLSTFLDWLLGVHPDRALLTWNGWRFDYRHVGAFVNRYVPHYADEWASIPKLDLYLWAVTDGNALLPGRSNTLDDVAEALDYEDGDTGLDGAATAAAYQRFVRTGDPIAWERHERYCEDDCRALWHVYERLRETTRETDDRSLERSVGSSPVQSGRTASDTARSSDSTPTGQTGLGDF